MDETDKKILELVQKAEYCKPNLTALSEQLKLSVPTLHARIKKLEDRGIIQGYMANVDPKKAGEDMTIFIIIRVEYKSFYEDEGKQREFAKKQLVDRLLSSEANVDLWRLRTGRLRE